MKERLFLYRVLKADKILFAVLILLIGAQLYYTRWQKEEFPVLQYGMYSLPEPNRTNYIVYDVLIDGQRVNTSSLWDARNELITSPLENFVQSPGDTNSQTQFLSWMLRYAGSQSSAASLKVYKYNCNYDTQGMIFALDTFLLYSYDAGRK